MRRWTNEEINILEKLYKEKVKLKDIAKIVNHPEKSVSDKAVDLKLSYKYPNHSKKYIHDEYFERLYRIYHHMKDRCNNPNHHEYYNYGGKGVTICNEWELFDNFKKWALSNGYDQNLTIDRIDSDGNYSPDNCQWITRSENTSKSNKQQHRKSNKGSYIGINEDGTTIVFDNANEFARNNNLNASVIRKYANNNNNKKYKGWVFKYAFE